MFMIGLRTVAQILAEVDVAVNLAVNCLHMHNPDGSRKTSFHLGFSKGVIELVWRDHRSFVIEQIKKLTTMVVDAPHDSEVGVVFWCKSGRHRPMPSVLVHVCVCVCVCGLGIPGFRVTQIQRKLCHEMVVCVCVCICVRIQAVG